MTGHRSWHEVHDERIDAMTPEQRDEYARARQEVVDEIRGICGHCHRPAVGYANANGTRLCHTGTVPMEDEPTDCYRLVVVAQHAADGSCCR